MATTMKKSVSFNETPMKKMTLLTEVPELTQNKKNPRNLRGNNRAYRDVIEDQPVNDRHYPS